MDNQIHRNMAEVMRDEMVMKEKIHSILKEDPKTIPEIASILKHPSAETILWVMAMWRYGFLEEVGKPNDEGYYKYRPVE